MYKGTTPTFTLTFPQTVDLTGASNVYVTFSAPDRTEILTKTGADLNIDVNVIEVFLTQEETLKMPCSCLLQVNWTYTEGGVVKRACSDLVTIINQSNLKNEVLT